MQQTQQRQQRDEGSPPPTAQLHLLVPAGERIHLLLHEQAEAADCILGFLHAYLVLHGGSSTHSSGSGPAVKQEQGAAVPAHAATSSSSGGDPAASMHHSLALARRLLPGLLAALEAAGWDDQKVVLEAKRRAGHVVKTSPRLASASQNRRSTCDHGFDPAQLISFTHSFSPYCLYRLLLAACTCCCSAACS